MIDAELLVGTVFSGLAVLTIDEIEDAGEMIVVRASTRGGAVRCPACGALTGRVHAFHERVPADVPIDGRRVLVRVRVRRMRCRAQGCVRQTFREQVPGVLERYQRRTVRLSEQLRGVVRELAGRASARLLPVMGIAAGKDAALRALLGIALPDRPVPRVLGIDDFALRRSRQYATVLIDAETGVRTDVLPGRGARVVSDWFREHPGVEVVCRDGSSTYAQAVRDAVPPLCRSRTGGTCGTAWPKQRPKRLRPTQLAGPEQPESRTGRWPAPRPSAGIRSMACSSKVSDCLSAPGG